MNRSCPFRRVSIYYWYPKLDAHRKQYTTTSSRWYHEVSYKRYGKDPKDVLSYCSDPRIADLDLPDPIIDDNKNNNNIDEKYPSFPDCRNEDGHGLLVRVEMMHVPWNPADVNTVQGRYPSPYPYAASSPMPLIASVSSSSSQSDRKSIRVASDRCIGRYFEKDPVIGSEGWGRVTHSASSSSSLSSSSFPPGTLVTMGLPGLGTLRSSLWVPASAVLPVPDIVWERLGPAGSSLFQLGGTALRLLSDFVVAAPGDVVIQNAGNSGVGFLASQLTASPMLLGSSNKNNNIGDGDGDSDSHGDSHGNTSTSNEYRSTTPIMVSLIRRRGKSKESFDETVDYLTRVGKNAFVVAEEDFFLPEDSSTSKDRENGTATTIKINEAAIREMRQRLRALSPTGSLPKLALNAVGGNSARVLLKLLEPNAGSTIVTYGGMSGKGVDVPTPQLIFNDVRAVGYWHSRWMVQQHEHEQAERKRRHARGETNNSKCSNSSDRDKPYSRRAEMVDILSRLVQEEDLKCPPAHIVRLEDLQKGLLWQANQSDCQSSDPSHQSPIRKKLVWDCGEQ
jgi:NADPH:quinone reductase-like Zn-dependent oxidoreductase